MRRKRPTPVAAAVGGRSPLVGTGAERPRHFHLAAPLWATSQHTLLAFARVLASGGPCRPICSAYAVSRRDVRAEGGPGAPGSALGSGARRARPNAGLPGTSAPGCVVHTGQRPNSSTLGASHAALRRAGPKRQLRRGPSSPRASSCHAARQPAPCCRPPACAWVHCAGRRATAGRAWPWRWAWRGGSRDMPPRHPHLATVQVVVVCADDRAKMFLKSPAY